jgi:hypothetical protein
LTDHHDDPWRAVVSPFKIPDDFDPIPGRCSRCQGEAWCDEGKWWHDGLSCAPRYGAVAEFIPDPPEG